jgi:hypothetical protein
VLIQELDEALAALIVDLEKRRLPDKVLIVISTEFGRPPEFDSGGGRGHHAKAFSGSGSRAEVDKSTDRDQGGHQDCRG